MTGAVATPVALCLAYLSMGLGHGNYHAAKILFPYTMLSTLWLKSITIPFVVLMFIQFPLYGALVSLAARYRVGWVAAACLIAIGHGAAVSWCIRAVSW